MNEQSSTTPTQKSTGNAPPCLALRPRQAAQALGIGERKLWEITADRTSGIPFIKLGKCVIYPVDLLREWLAQQTKGGDRQ